MDIDDLVGFRFTPSEEELLCYYLRKKLNGTTTPTIDNVIPVVHIYDYNPWELPQFGGDLCPVDTEEWFFFTPMQEREARGGRPSRLTETGYWKATGSPGDVYSSQNLRIGRKRIMVFYEGRAPNGRKTSWKMNEYKLYENTSDHHHSPQLREDLSLYRIYKRSKRTRAFDRGPPPPAASTSHDQAAVQYGNEVVMSRVENHEHNPAVESEFNWEMAIGTQPLWDSSQVAKLLDWFDL